MGRREPFFRSCGPVQYFGKILFSGARKFVDGSEYFVHNRKIGDSRSWIKT